MDNIYDGKKCLVTTDGWFYAPDGLKYRSAWGRVSIFSDKILGVETNDRSSNWFVQIGQGDGSIVVAGCQIHYAIICERPPKSGRIKEFLYSSRYGSKLIKRDSEIYMAD